MPIAGALCDCGPLVSWKEKVKPDATDAMGISVLIVRVRLAPFQAAVPLKKESKDTRVMLGPGVWLPTRLVIVICGEHAVYSCTEGFISTTILLLSQG